MIHPDEIPQIPGDMDALAAHAEALTAVGSGFASTGQAIDTTWQGLAGVYRAPEAEQLFAATGPVRTVSASVGEDMRAVGAALAAYAAEVTEIKARLAALKTEAGQFVASVDGDKDWREDDRTVDRHNGLISAVNNQVAAFFEAQRRCANTINALYYGRQYRADNGDGKAEDGEYGYTADLLNAAAREKGLLPWGATVDHDRGVAGDVGAFFAGVGEGFINMVTDLGALIGRDPTTGDWSWGAAGAAWKGLGEFAYAGAIYTSASMFLPDLLADDPDAQRKKAGNLLLNAGKTMIAYDTWGHDKSHAAGQTTFNVVSSIVGTKGASAGLRGTGAAVGAVHGSATAARIGAGLTRAAGWIDNLPTAGQIATNIAHRLHLDIPHLGPVPAIAGDVPINNRGIDVDPPNTHGTDPMHMNSAPDSGPAPTGRGGSDGAAGGVPGDHAPGGSAPNANTPGVNAPDSPSSGGHPPGDGTPGGAPAGDDTPGIQVPDGSTPAGDASPNGSPPAGNTPGGGARDLSPAERQEFLDTAERLGPHAEARARNLLERQDLPDGMANQAIRDFVDLHNSGRIAGTPAHHVDIFRNILGTLDGTPDNAAGMAAELRAANDVLHRPDLAPGSRIGLNIAQGERVDLGNGTVVDTGRVPQTDLIYQTADGRVHLEEVKTTASAAVNKFADSSQLQRMLDWRTAAPGRDVAVRIGTEERWTDLFRNVGASQEAAIQRLARQNVSVVIDGRTLTPEQMNRLHRATDAASKDPAHPIADTTPANWFARHLPNLDAAREFLRPYGVDFL
jgi:hypothetical protein